MRIAGCAELRIAGSAELRIAGAGGSIQDDGVEVARHAGDSDVQQVHRMSNRCMGCPTGACGVQQVHGMSNGCMGCPTGACAYIMYYFAYLRYNFYYIRLY